jgi:hypothetical protein
LLSKGAQRRIEIALLTRWFSIPPSPRTIDSTLENQLKLATSAPGGGGPLMSDSIEWRNKTTPGDSQFVK